MASDVHIAVRNGAFEPERKVTLSIEGVIRIAGAKDETRLPVHDIGLIELSAEASVAHDVAFICQIYRKRAWFPALTLKSKRYRGVGDFADQRGDYRAFVNALHTNIIERAWPVKTQVAARPSALLLGLWSYAHWAVLIWIGVFMAGVLALAALEPQWARAIPEISAILATAATLAYAMTKLAGIRAAYGPWTYEADQIPASVLPEPLAMD